MANKLSTKRHSVAHLLATVIKKLYPNAKLGIGPAIKDGFYYDFYNLNIKEKDIPKIENEVKKLAKKEILFKKLEISKKEAKKIFKNEPFKLELINELKDEKISVYQSGDFVDLCKGPHIKSTKELNPKGIKILELAGSYWKGKETNPMLLRIYGTYFDDEKKLKKYLENLEEIKKSNHKVIGEELNLFGIYPETIGSGLVLWHPNGAIVRKEIEDFWKEVHLENNYQLVYTPHIGRLELWKKSGHFQHYKEMMYVPIKMEDESYLLKPMNCPFHVQIYSSRQRSYKDLPIRLAELGTVYRYEKKGVLLGLLRVRGFTQDDAHIFCSVDQLEEEIEKVYELALSMLKIFGFKKFEVELALRDSQNKKGYIGNSLAWKKAEEALRKVLNKKKVKFKEGIGEAKFYGPSIDIKLLDNLERSWQGPTIQVDFNFPEKFNLYFINKEGKKERPVMIHRTVLGAIERFVANLTEQYKGAFPVWLSPIQIAIIPVNENFSNLALKIAEKLKEFRTKVMSSSETVSKRIMEGEKQKIPYIIVIGEKEKDVLSKNTPIPVRIRGKGVLKMGLKNFKEYVDKKINKKSVEP